jgi:hypothetical protein
MTETLTIDERLESTKFPAPLIREMNQAAHADSINLGIGQL